MKLLDKQSNTEFKDLYLFLNRKEASDLAHEVKKLLQNPNYTAIVKGEDISGKYTKKVILKILPPSESPVLYRDSDGIA